MSKIDSVAVQANGQFTLPPDACRHLQVTDGGHIGFVAEGGVVTLHRCAEDYLRIAALSPTLALIEAEITASPEQAILPVTAALVGKMKLSTAKIDPLKSAILGHVSW